MSYKTKKQFTSWISALLPQKLTVDNTAYKCHNKSMEHIDFRKLNNDELYSVRKQVVRLKKQGRKGSEIEEITGVYQNRISQIWTAYQTDGTLGIKPKKSGRKAKSQMLLSAGEQQNIRQTIISNAPNQRKMEGFLWTLAKISQYIWRTCHKCISVRCLSNYMKRWGLTCQRPTKRACGQDIARIERFKKKEYPAIAVRAKKEKRLSTGVMKQASATERILSAASPKKGIHLCCQWKPNMSAST